MVKVLENGGLPQFFLFVMYSNEHPQVFQQMCFKLEISNVSMEQMISQTDRPAVSAFKDPRLLPLEAMLHFNQTLLGEHEHSKSEFNVRLSVREESVEKYLSFQ